ncbi:MAG: FadR/GntR family transcriptional regulator [Chloroflexota bacterium]
MVEDKLADVVPIKSNRVYEEVVLQMKKFIAEGRLAPGERLPPERELAERFGVGRNSIREAIRQLELLGLVEVRQGEGTFITEATIENIVTPLSSILLHSAARRNEVLDFRKLLEPGIAGLAATRATPENIAKIEALLHQFEDFHASPESPLSLAMELDTQFHYAIAEASQNGLISWVLDAVMGLLRDFRQQLLEEIFRSSSSVEAHQAIFHAIKARDSHLAYEAMKRHLEYLEKHLQSRLDESSAQTT